MGSDKCWPDNWAGVIVWKKCRALGYNHQLGSTLKIASHYHKSKDVMITVVTHGLKENKFKT